MADLEGLETDGKEYGFQEQCEPLLTVDIDLHVGKDQIVIFPGDSIEVLSELFVLKHNLDVSMVEKLTNILNNALDDEDQQQPDN